MANKIQLKRSNIQNKVPSTTDVDLGELALNTYDGKLYTKKSDGTTETVVQLSVDSTVVKTTDSAKVTSAMIVDGTIVNADVNASAAIAGTKISPDFGSQTITTTGVVSAAAGAAATPSIAFTGDLNTGIYSPGADQVALTTGGTGRLFISSTGRLGLGTAASIAPSAPLDDFHIASTDPALLLEETDAGTDEKYWRIRADGSILRFEGVNDAFNATTTWLNVTRATGARTADNIAFTTGTNERLRIDSSGRLLVGTSSSSVATSAVFQGHSSSSIQDGRLFIQRGATTLGANTRTGQINFADSAGNVGSTIESWSDDAWAASDYPGRLVFSTTADGALSPAERVRIDSSGRVGIGTTSPQTTTHIQTTNQFSSTAGNTSAGLLISQSGGTPGDGAYGTAITLSKINSTRPGGAITSIQTTADDDQLGLAFLVHASATTNDTLTEALRISHAGTATFTAAASSAPFIANIGASEVARIDSSGRLLVGTSTSYALGKGRFTQTQVHGLATANASSGLCAWGTAAQPELNLTRSRGTAVGTRAVVNSGDILGDLFYSGDDGTNFIPAASIQAVVDGTPGANSMPGRIVLSTTLDGVSSPTERLRITNDGVQCYNRPAPAAVNATATLTVANLKAGIITSTSAAATDMTLPTGTDTEAGFSSVYTNFTFEWSVINTGPSLVRVLAGTAHTIVGSGSVATGTSGRFASRRTAANTFVSYRLS